METKPYVINVLSGYENDDEVYVEIARCLRPNYEEGFCSMRKRGDKIEVDIVSGYSDDAPKHDFEKLMEIMRQASVRLRGLYQD